MPKPVVVTITGRELGRWILTPFQYGPGLQRYASGAFVRYEVPIYAVSVKGGREFKAIRFGLVNRGVLPPPAVRTCDAGLSAARVANPSWVATYSPHSFRLPGRPGAWRLIEGKGFLIHQGTDDPTTTAGGSLGCVEIVGKNEWNSFLGDLESISGADCARIASSKAITVKVEHATFPTAKLV